MKYTPLAEVLKDKRVLLVEDTIVRSTTMKALIHQIRERGLAREVHVRVACPPILSPCFYGIDMSTVKELFAPKFLKGQPISRKSKRRWRSRWGPIRSGTCRWNPSRSRSTNRATRFVRRALTDATRPPRGGGCTRSLLTIRGRYDFDVRECGGRFTNLRSGPRGDGC